MAPIPRGSTAPGIARKYASITAIITVPLADSAKYAEIVEQLSCGHHGGRHGATWEGTDAPLRQHPEQYAWLIGRKRLCRYCSGLAHWEQAETNQEAIGKEMSPARP